METIFTDRERHELAGRARTLGERLTGPSNDPGMEPPIDPEEILTAWKDLFPNERLFQDRLAHEGLTESDVREQLLATSWPADEPIPGWVYDVEELIRYVHRAVDEECTGDPAGEETPFAELLGTIGEFARRQLPVADVPMDAISPMIEWLVSRLETLCIRPLYVEFKSFIEYHDPELAQADPNAFDEPPATYYEQFVDAVLDGGLVDIFLEYPVLARHLIRLLDYWVQAVTEVCRRVEADRAGLRERFGVDGDVTALEPLTDDTHARGRVPVRISFDSTDVIYKPRPVAASSAFYTILDRLDDHIPAPSFATPTCWSRERYGWMEPIEYSDPTDENGVERYYERAGVLLCTAYVLNFSDNQFENVIVAENTPMVIDGETLFHPDIASMVPVEPALASLVNGSILRTAFLPLSVGSPSDTDEDGFMTSIAGLGCQSEPTRVSNVSDPVIEAVNTDVMSVRAKNRTVDRSANTPTVAGKDRPPEDHVEAIVRGFENTHETIRKLHADGRFLAEIADPELTGGIENRLVYRATMQYKSALQDALARDSLRDGARTSLEFERLTISLFEDGAEIDRFWPLYDAERTALARLDVPRFTSRTDRRTVYHDGRPVDMTTDASGYERCRERLDRMDVADQHRQVALIRQSFESAEPSGTVPAATDVTDAERIRDAVELFDDALAASVETGDRTGWVSFVETGPIRLEPAGPAVYHGRSGIALAGAGLYRVTGRDRYRRHVAEILEPVVEDVPGAISSLDLGGTRGIGAMVYALSVVAELLDADDYRQAALTATRAVTAERLAADDTFDVMEGTAGALLGLLAFHDRFGGSEILDRALACGERLLEARTGHDGYQVWETGHDDTPLAGFAHGNSGIGYALARLASTADEPRFGEAARDALAFDSAAASSVSFNQAASPVGHDQGSLDWCHGRAGDALARIGAGNALDDEVLLDEASNLLSAAAAADPSSYDNVCCGNFGRVEALLAGSRHIDSDLTDGSELASRCLASRQGGGTLDLPGHSNAFVNPTFFDGVSGVAYTLARLEAPDALPSVLVLE